ncbi:hypothetical protein J6590_102694 [Homalodisca vitripennis]|nr:hypothetical protein J6590_102694 [Homalodisca vitripennis]
MNPRDFTGITVQHDLTVKPSTVMQQLQALACNLLISVVATTRAICRSRSNKINTIQGRVQRLTRAWRLLTTVLPLSPCNIPHILPAVTYTPQVTAVLGFPHATGQAFSFLR